MNYLAIDYGEKRIGLAHGDDELGIALPVPAAVEAEFDARIDHIGAEIRARRIGTLIVGYPVNMDGSHGFKTREVDAFIALLETRFGLPVVRVDETLSSYEAESEIASRSRGNAGRKKTSARHDVRSRQKQRRSGEVDSRAAAVFLQDYFNATLRL